MSVGILQILLVLFQRVYNSKRWSKMETEANEEAFHIMETETDDMES